MKNKELVEIATSALDVPSNNADQLHCWITAMMLQAAKRGTFELRDASVEAFFNREDLSWWERLAINEREDARDRVIAQLIDDGYEVRAFDLINARYFKVDIRWPADADREWVHDPKKSGYLRCWQYKEASDQVTLNRNIVLRVTENCDVKTICQWDTRDFSVRQVEAVADRMFDNKYVGTQASVVEQISAKLDLFLPRS